MRGNLPGGVAIGVALLAAEVETHTWPGGHDRTYWDAHTADYLRFYTAALADCRP